MQNPIKKIGIILFVFVFFPALIFSIYELNNLNETEEIIEVIYQKQLESILFSVNQYSEDIVSNWATQINIILLESGDNFESIRNKLNNFFIINNSIECVFFTGRQNSATIVFNSSNIDTVYNSADMNDIIISSKDIISRLLRYKEEGYRKISPITYSDRQSLTSLIFISDEKNTNLEICGIVINPALFIQNLLAPKLQEIAQEDIVLLCIDADTKQVIFSTLPLEDKIVQKESSFWFLPTYKLGIALKGRTIEGLVKQRSISSLILIIVLTFVILAGVLFVFRNIRREIKFAQMKSDFVSNVSHELRTPLALISMFSETLELNRVKSEEKKEKYLKIISQEANRLGKIVNTLLNFSKMEAGKRKYNFNKIELNELVNDIMNTYDFHLKNNGFIYEKNLFEKEIFVRADSEALSEAFINILDNAVKYSREKKEVHIKTGIANNYSFIEVKDYGVGISSIEQKRIFEKFYRVSSGLEHTSKGTGMGLSIVKHILDAHKGKIELISEQGEGSTFRLCFQKLI
ncbi:sensor histidine kinase [Bacteroidota bacterium]